MRWFNLTLISIVSILNMMNFVFGFDAQGHRGARGLMPENTLAGFAKALSIGVNTLELDIGMTRDGIIVVTHNPQLESDITRDENGNWLGENNPAVYSLSHAELNRFDVGQLKPGTRYADRFDTQVAIDGARIPTLSDVLDLVSRSANDTVRLNIETKLQPGKPGLTTDPKSMISELLRILEEQGFLDRVTIQSFDWRTLQVAQRMAPNIPTSYLTVQQPWYDNLQSGEDGPSPWTAGFDIDDYDGSAPKIVQAAGGYVWSPFHMEVTQANIEQAHSLGLKVKVWTVNDPVRMVELILMGVDGIITDYPDILRSVMTDRDMTLAPATPVSP